jgi:hypothetical protein
VGYGQAEVIGFEPFVIMRLESRKMARKKKIKRFQAVQAVKELARERMGAPPVEKVVPHKNKKASKHKATLERLLDEVE